MTWSGAFNEILPENRLYEMSNDFTEAGITGIALEKELFEIFKLIKFGGKIVIEPLNWLLAMFNEVILLKRIFPIGPVNLLLLKSKEISLEVKPEENVPFTWLLLILND